MSESLDFTKVMQQAVCWCKRLSFQFSLLTVFLYSTGRREGRTDAKTFLQLELLRLGVYTGSVRRDREGRREIGKGEGR